jgi:hypothetical protein
MRSGAVAAGNDNVLLIGDRSQYLVADRVGMTAKYIPHRFPHRQTTLSEQRGWYAF